MTADRVFVDTNVLLYAHDRSAGQKHVIARELLAELWGNRHGVLSTQVLQEFYVNATRKLPQPMPASRARAAVKRYATWPVYRIEADDIVRASELERRHRQSFWDALIVTAAWRLGAATVYTEDMQHGRCIGGIGIVDPFRAD